MERVAQWSATAGLHIYTEGMHRSCLRIIVPWTKAKAIVDQLKRGRMEDRMKKTEEIVDQLVKAADGGLAVVVVGPYGCGKVWMCDMAAKKMGLEVKTISLPVMEISDIPAFDDLRPTFDNLPDSCGVIIDGLHSVPYEHMPRVALTIIEAVRCAKGRRAFFITVPPDNDRYQPSLRIREFLAPATGVSVGAELRKVEITK